MQRIVPGTWSCIFLQQKVPGTWSCIVGIDLSIKRKSGICVVDKYFKFINPKFQLGLTVRFNELVRFLSEERDIQLVVIDAPLTYPDKNFRDAEIELRKEGIRALPLNFLSDMENLIQEILKVYKGEIIETFPDGVFKFLNLKGGRKLRSDREVLFKELKRFIKFPLEFSTTNRDFIDACLCVICGIFYVKGETKKFGGKEGTIYLPTIKSFL